MLKHPTILIAPLDWGIGHATRIIPIINYLIDQDYQVVIAAEGVIKALLAQEFPQLQFILLNGYGIKYSKYKKYLPVKIAFQIPGIIISIIKEHNWLKKVVKIHRIDGIISDNRFGLFHATIPCTYITHQLMIKTGNTFLEVFLQNMHNWFIRKYTFCWVPDYQQPPALAGELSHPKYNLPDNIQYIGALSRFNKIGTTEKIYKLLILLSGPEPQRSIVENLLLSQVGQFKEKVLFVRGLPHEKMELLNGNFNKNLEIKNHLSAKALNLAIESAELIICRSGYTTVMDLIKLQKKAILIPTPGQTEQTYLAKYLMQQHLFYAVDQKDFNLSTAIKNAEKFSFNHVKFNMDQYQNAVDNFVKQIKN